VSEALRPAAATDRWQQLTSSDFPACVDAAFATLSVVEAANAEEEALAIAVALREVMETAAKTAALITPDRELARRVLGALERWHIPVDDSGGDALPDTSAGRFARLAAEAALGGLAPVTLLALLKHPLTRLGAPEGANTRAVAALERAVLRGPRPKPKSHGLIRALQRFGRNSPSFDAAKNPICIHPIPALLERRRARRCSRAARTIRAAIAPLEALSGAPLSFAELAARHCDVVTALSRTNAVSQRPSPAMTA
jgi:ATP-dependent helicase/nuclease subunit B